jgi:fatty-acyl-CoA synthase
MGERECSCTIGGKQAEMRSDMAVEPSHVVAASSQDIPPVASLADIEAIERIPLEARHLPPSTFEMLERGAGIAPNAPALSFFLNAKNFKRSVVWTHDQLMRSIRQAANAFRRLGIGRNDVIAYVLPNLPETHFVIWGGEAAGIVFAINPLLEASQIAELLKAGGAKWLVTLAPTPGADIWQKSVQAAAQVPGLKGILTVEIAPYLPPPLRQAVAAWSRLQMWRSPRLAIPVLNLRSQMRRENAQALDFARPQPDDIASYFCTGGTTGLPKIARRTHFSEVYDAWAMMAVLGLSGSGRTIFCGLPLFHVNAQLTTGLAPWSRGDHVVLATPQGYRHKGLLARFWQIAAHYKIFGFSGVPTVYAALSQIPVGENDISRIDFGFCGAAPMPKETFNTFETKTGVRILEAYGLTEAACASSINPPAGDRRIGSIGLRFPYQQMAVFLLDEAGAVIRPAETGEIGILAVKGPNVFAGYVNPAHNAGIWIEHQGERWLNTGDLGRQDAEGYFWLTGRKKELIIRGGHNIDPKLIEEPMHRHPAVALAAAIGRPDRHAGEVPVLYVQLKPGEQVSEAALSAHAADHIPERAAHPKIIRIVSDLPLTPIGKIFKPALAMREIEDVVRTESTEAQIVLARVEIVQDASRGIVARIALPHDSAAFRTALGAYAFAHDIECDGAR